MGYTHYFYQQRGWSDLEWGQLMAAWRVLAEEAKALGIVLKGPDGTGEPTVRSFKILFNGDGDQGLDHETMGLTRRPSGKKYKEGWFNFCKTAHKPYDLIVQTILLISNMICVHAGISPSGTKIYNIGSDGGDVDPENPEWKDAFELAEKVYSKTFPI